MFICARVDSKRERDTLAVYERTFDSLKAVSKMWGEILPSLEATGSLTEMGEGLCCWCYLDPQ